MVRLIIRDGNGGVRREEKGEGRDIRRGEKESANYLPGRKKRGARIWAPPFRLHRKFHYFCAKYFSSFRNFPPTVLDIVTTKFDETGADLINIS